MLLTRPQAVTETRSITIDDLAKRLDNIGFSTASGAYVTAGMALRQTTVWACARILGEGIGQLPIMVQEKNGGKWVEIADHDVLELLFEPNEWMSQHDLLSFLTVQSELNGNGYLYKGKDSKGRVRRLVPLKSEGVSLDVGSRWEMSYTVGQENGFNGAFTPKEIFHLRNFGSDGVIGLSTVANLREAIGLALKTEEHGARLFKNGAKVGMSIEVPGELGEAAYERLISRIKEQYTGTENAHKTMLIEGGGKVNPIGMTSEDAQFLETRRFQKQEIASLFGVPLFLLNDTEKSTTWGTGLEQISKAFVRYTLSPRLSRITHTLNKELLPPNERRKTRFVFNTDAFTMGEFKERMDGYKVAIDAGVLNPNEAREEEGRNPRDGGDEYRKPLNIGIENETQTPDPPA